MNLPERFNAFVRSGNLLADEHPTLLAVSGGVDSLVMAHLFRQADHAFGIAHCNFGLRGADSDADEFFVRQLAGSWGVPFFATGFETTTYAEQNGLSIQMAARELRYAWFRKIAAENDYLRIATAHNLNDSVETALLNFTRGTGLSGLTGIAASSFPAGDVIGLIRPILFAGRSEIEEYARDQNLAWREDSSNAGDEYTRNFLRHRIIPLLEELNPDFLHTAGRNLNRLRETDENLHFLLQNYFGENATPGEGFYIDKQKLVQLPAPRRALRELLKIYGFTEEQCRQVAEGLHYTGLEIHSGSGWRLLNDREKILLATQSPIPNPQSLTISILPDDLMVTLPARGRLLLIYSDVASAFPDGRAAVLVDAEKLQFPLLLRPWQAGDHFQPFGLNGHSQKLQDFFTNLKLSRFEKEKVLVLENGDGAILWVVGYRLDERFRVTSATHKFLKISYL
ncbi:MAG TPA: tRNA lysidine(34) synthetase TilS [Saprospiraceae bacterium]|nr:tRNA lysidine(34) synthetase TilS [Saprospiraceae bacterium]